MARTQGKPEMAGDDVVDGEFEDDGDKGSGGGALATVHGTRIEAPHITAIACQVPRDIIKLVPKAIKEAEMMGEDFYYSWRQGAGFVEGVSIDGSLVLLRHWGNATQDIDIAEEGPKHWVLKAWMIDLEAGVAFPRLYRQRKGESHQKKGKDGDADRLLDIAFNIGQSKAQRNAIVKYLPAHFVNKCLEAAKKSHTEGIAKNLPLAIKMAKDSFEKIGVKVADLERLLENPEAMWSPADTRLLGGIYRAIVSRETSVPKEFPWLAVTPEAAKAEGVQTPGSADAPPASGPQPTTGATPPPDASAQGSPPSPTPPATTATEAPKGPPCLDCGRPVPGNKAEWVDAKNGWRHPGGQCPPADAPPAPPPPPPPRPPAPAPPRLHAGPQGARRRRRPRYPSPRGDRSYGRPHAAHGQGEEGHASSRGRGAGRAPSRRPRVGPRRAEEGRVSAMPAAYYILHNGDRGVCIEGPLSDAQVAGAITPTPRNEGKNSYGQRAPRFLKVVPTVHKGCFEERGEDWLVILKAEVVVPQAVDVVTSYKVP
jgi:hypothetical protein